MSAWREFWGEVRILVGQPESWHRRAAVVAMFPFLLVAFLLYRLALWFDPE